MCARRKSRKPRTQNKLPRPRKPPKTVCLEGEEIDRHHRLPRSRGGGNQLSNISLVLVKHHRAFHLLFGNATADEVAEILNRTWISPHYKLVVVRNTE